MEEAAYRYLAQGLQQVLAQLPAQKTAAELMTRRVFCVRPEMTMEEARRLMLKVNKKSTCNTLGASGAKQQLKHGLGTQTSAKNLPLRGSPQLLG